MRRGKTLLALAVVAGACRELPIEAPSVPALPTEARRTTAITCDKYWTIAVSGAWLDHANWSPFGAPSSSDNVCFSAAGIYTVGIGTNLRIGELYVDDNVAVTIQSSAIEFLTAQSTTVARTGRLSVIDCAALISLGGGVVDGNLTLRADCIPTYAGTYLGDMQLNGLLELDNARLLHSNDFTLRNEGEIILYRYPRIKLPTANSSLQMAGGRIIGSGVLEVWGNGSFDWSAGSLLVRQTVASGASVLVNANLNLASTSLVGAVDIQGGTASVSGMVTGHIGPNVDLGMVGSGTVELKPPAATPNDPYEIRGKLTVPISGSLQAVAGDVTNTGTINVQYPVAFLFDKLDNLGTMEISHTLNFNSSSGAKLHNKGTINVHSPGDLLMTGSSEFVIHSNSSQSGDLELRDTSLLRGDGVVGIVKAYGGTVSPGSPSTPLGTIQVESLLMGTAGRLLIDATGPDRGQYDRIVSAGLVSYGGTFELRASGGFVGGVCGQTLSVIDLPAGLGTKTFAAFVGFQPSGKTAWRTYYASTQLAVVGFDPTVRVGVSATAVALGEPAPSAALNVCLGTRTPGKYVTLSQHVGTTQARMIPLSVRFDLVDWMLPRAVTLQAIDDTLAEGPHSASVAFLTSSGDPAYDRTTSSSITANITDNDPGADLSIAVAQGPTAPVPLNGDFDVRFRVSNAGPGASPGSTFTLTPMAGIEYISVNGAACVPTAGVLTCTVGAVTAGGFLDFAVSMRAIASGVHTNTLSIAGHNFDPNTANNSANWIVTVQ